MDPQKKMVERSIASVAPIRTFPILFSRVTLLPIKVVVSISVIHHLSLSTAPYPGTRLMLRVAGYIAIPPIQQLSVPSCGTIRLMKSLFCQRASRPSDTRMFKAGGRGKVISMPTRCSEIPIMGIIGCRMTPRVSMPGTLTRDWTKMNPVMTWVFSAEKVLCLKV